MKPIFIKLILVEVEFLSGSWKWKMKFWQSEIPWFKQNVNYFIYMYLRRARRVNISWRWCHHVCAYPPRFQLGRFSSPSFCHYIMVINTLRPWQNGCHFADSVFKCFFLKDNWLKISLKFVPKGPINNIPSLFQIMAWRWTGDKPLSEPMMFNLVTHICITRPQWVKGMRFDINILVSSWGKWCIQFEKCYGNFSYPQVLFAYEVCKFNFG